MAENIRTFRKNTTQTSQKGNARFESRIMFEAPDAAHGRSRLQPPPASLGPQHPPPLPLLEVPAGNLSGIPTSWGPVRKAGDSQNAGIQKFGSSVVLYSFIENACVTHTKVN